MTMTTAARTAGPPRSVSLVAPSGAPVELTLPTEFGEYRWYANTRFTGPRMARQFFLAPAGEHRAIPAKLMPGAREHRQGMRGFDAVVFEAPDRSDSALVLAGPHHEATTWFGGPAPDVAGLNALLSALRFSDSPQGASLTPVSDMLVKQGDEALIGRSDQAMLLVRRSVDMLPVLPEWSGFRLPGGEMWRAGRVLGEQAAAQVADTPHQWRYLLAGDSVAMDLVLLGPESGRAVTDLAEGQVVDALSALRGRWAA
jgi:hypothetical protein